MDPTTPKPSSSFEENLQKIKKFIESGGRLPLKKPEPKADLRGEHSAVPDLPDEDGATPGPPGSESPANVPAGILPGESKLPSASEQNGSMRISENAEVNADPGSAKIPTKIPIEKESPQKSPKTRSSNKTSTRGKLKAGKLPFMKFFPKDWIADMLQHPLEIGGAWINIICHLWESPTRGESTMTLQQWTRILGNTEEKAGFIISYLMQYKIADIVTLGNGKVTVISRRIKREEKEREFSRLRQRRFKESRKSNGKSNGDLTPYISYFRSQKSEIKTKKLFVEGSDELRLATLLLSKILERKADFRKPDLQAWAKEIDLMIRRDQRTPDRIEKVILWIQGDSCWWQNNILSTSSLREKFDRLELEMNKEKKSIPPKSDPLENLAARRQREMEASESVPCPPGLKPDFMKEPDS